MRKKIIGILGGMGPAATIALYENIVRLTPAMSDQEHLKTIIYSDPEMPDRTNAILNEGEDPTDRMYFDISSLKKAGANLLIVPCNTAHAFVPSIARKLGIDFIDMIAELKVFIQEKYPKCERIGLLATIGTYKLKLYERYFTSDYKIIEPSKKDKQKIMNCIYGIKSKKNSSKQTQEVLEIADVLISKGADLIILGCTELSLIKKFKRKHLYIDPLEILAQTTVNRAMPTSRNE